MKNKLIFIVIIAVLALVGYQKYVDYRILKPIDSQPIQFPLYSPTNSPVPQISQQDLQQGWYWGSADQKKIGTPSNWLYLGQGKSSCWHSVDVVCAP